MLPRGSGAIQFGLDARTAGVFRPPEGLEATVTRILRSPATSQAALMQRLTRAGLPAEMASGLVQDLLAHGVLQTHAMPPVVAVVGEHPLRPFLLHVLKAMQARVLSDIAGELPPDAFVREALPIATVVSLSPLPYEPALAGELAWRANAIPVSLVDGRGVIGPLRINGLGACTMCAELHRSRVDPHWVEISHAARRAWDHSTRPQPTASTAVLAATAAAVGALIESKAHPHPAPGLVGHAAQPGQMLVVEPLRVETTYVPRHPQCPLCWAIETEQASKEDPRHSARLSPAQRRGSKGAARRSPARPQR